MVLENRPLLLELDKPMTPSDALVRPACASLDAASARAPSNTNAQIGGPYRIWADDLAEFSTHRIAPLRHNFDQHPMLQLPQLAELAREMVPAGLCRFIVPGSTQSSEFFHQPTCFDGRDVDEVFRRIEEPGSWIALYNVETVPRYRAFLDEVMDTVRPLVEHEQPNIFMVNGFIFISAPPSVTPFHIDRENNFWLQIKGRKAITVWDHNDRKIVPAKDVEDFIVYRSLDRVRLKEEFRVTGRDLDRGPGEGLYFPSTTPHMTRTTTEWVVPGDGVSISIGVTFYTSVTRRYALVHQVNRALRRMGLDPTPPGRSAWRDILKAPLGKAIVATQKRRSKKYVPPPGAS
jgi:hypothetical protein